MAKKSGFVTCGPNEALVVSGCCHRRPLMIPGGRVFVWPSIQKVQRISLNTMTLVIESPRVYTKEGVPISVIGIAQVKIQGQNADMLRSACEQFLGKTETEIMYVARETLEGHQRAIMASMTVEEIYKNRKKFSKKVFEVASTDLVDMGLLVVSYTLKDINDDEGYLLALGLARTAEVKRDARIGEAQAQKEASIQEALANQEKQQAELECKTKIAKSKKDFEIKKAEYDKEVFTKKADAELATELQTAIIQKEIKEEQMKVKLVEKEQDIIIAKVELERRRKELEATIMKSAEAEYYRLQKLAEANKQTIELEGDSTAKAIELKGVAEAEAYHKRIKAEAEILAQKAEAYREYDNSAKIDMVLDTLPKVAAEIAGPLSECSKIVMVSNTGEIGAGKMTGEVMEIITKIHSSVATMISSSTSAAAHQSASSGPDSGHQHPPHIGQQQFHGVEHSTTSTTSTSTAKFYHPFVSRSPSPGVSSLSRYPKPST